MKLYVITALDGSRTRCSNVFTDKKTAIDYIKENGFDVWEGYTNKYIVLESMPVGEPWNCQEEAWYSREKLEKSCDAVIYEIDKPKSFKGICNFGIG